jgi:hypothetical protein
VRGYGGNHRRYSHQEGVLRNRERLTWRLQDIDHELEKLPETAVEYHILKQRRSNLKALLDRLGGPVDPEAEEPVLR